MLPGRHTTIPNPAKQTNSKSKGHRKGNQEFPRRMTIASSLKALSPPNNPQSSPGTPGYNSAESRQRKRWIETTKNRRPQTRARHGPYISHLSPLTTPQRTRIPPRKNILVNFYSSTSTSPTPLDYSVLYSARTHHPGHRISHTGIPSPVSFSGYPDETTTMIHNTTQCPRGVKGEQKNRERGVRARGSGPALALSCKIICQRESRWLIVGARGFKLQWSVWIK